MEHTQYAIITENDVSAWHDQTGILYHYPQRYLSLLKPGTHIIYYKGKIRDKKFQNSRLSNEPHYFGRAIMGKQFIDTESHKHDYYSEIKEYHLFTKPIPFKIANEYIEEIPTKRKNNYWRDAVRVISQETYKKILQLNESDFVSDHSSLYVNSDTNTDLETRVEGKKTTIYTTTYERNPKLRAEAIKKHGLTCMACGFNFEKVYGVLGKDFIHVHHLKPLHLYEEQQVNPTTDLIVLCPNCHYMIHRNKDKILTLKELQQIIKQV